MKLQEVKRDKLYIELIRIIAVCLVILNHIDITALYYHNTDNIITFSVSLLVTILVHMDIPLFVMISGSLLGNKDESISYIFRYRLLRIVSVIIIFSIVQYIEQAFRGKISAPGVADFIKRIISGDIQETYWYLYAYLGILLLLPFLRKIVRNVSIPEMILLFCINFLVCAIGPLDVIPINSSFISIVSTFTSLVFYFILGYFVDRCLEVSQKLLKVSIGLILISLTIEFVPSFIIFYSTGKVYDFLLSTTTSLLTPSLFLLIKYLWIQNDHNQIFSNIVKTIGGCTFGIYLVEQLSRVILSDLYLYLIDHTYGVIASFVFFLATFILSLAISLIMKKIPGLKKLL